MEKTLIIIKPDATDRNLTGPILARFEQEGFRISGIKNTRFSLQQAKRFYLRNIARPGYLENASFMSSGMLVCAVLSRKDAVAKARELVGSWDPAKAVSGTIRKDFGVPDSRGILNVVHASDSIESAQREIFLTFGAEVVDVYANLA